jgi:hypothetical protein
VIRRALPLAVLLLASCEQRIPARPAPPPPPAPKIGVFSATPAGYERPGCAVAAFEDRTGQKLDGEAAELLDGLLRDSGRFVVLERQEYRRRLDDPGRPPKQAVRGAEYVFEGTLHRYAVSVTRSEKSQPVEIQVVLETEVRFIDGANGEILVHQRGNRSRQRNLKTWGLRLLRAGGDAPTLDEASRAKVLRADLDESLHSMLPSFDEKFTKASAPK